jgi:hypothetical protein
MLLVALLFVAGLVGLEVHDHGLSNWRQFAGLAILAAIVEVVILVLMLPIIWLAPHARGPKAPVSDYGAPRARPIGAISAVVFVVLYVALMFGRMMFSVAFVTPPSWSADHWADWRSALPHYLHHYLRVLPFVIGAILVGYAWTAYVHFRDRRAARKRRAALSLEGA